MRPGFAIDNAINAISTNAIFFCQKDLLFALSDTLAYHKYLFSCKFRSFNFFATGLTFLLCLVRHVVLCCARPEMVRIATRRVVAFVANFFAQRNFAMRHKIGGYMSEMPFAMKVESSVAATDCASCPNPAFVWLSALYMLPKFLCQSHVWSGGIVSGAKASWISSPNRSLLSAATFAEFYRGLFSGMILHVDTFLSRFGKSQGRDDTRCLAISIGCYRSILAQTGGYC